MAALPTSSSIPSTVPSALDGQLSISTVPESHSFHQQVLSHSPHIQDCERPEQSSSSSNDVIEAWIANAVQKVDQMKSKKTVTTIGILSTLIAYVSINSLARSLQPEIFVWQDEDREDDTWMASSRSWIDRKACRWLSLCGLSHVKGVQNEFNNHAHHNHKDQTPLDGSDRQSDWQWEWNEGKERPEDWSDDERVLHEIPQYVMDYAPLVHLFSGEQFWPSDIAEHLYHITPRLNYTPVQSSSEHPNLTDLDQLNQWERGRHVYLTSDDDVEDRPEWLLSAKNIPRPIPDQGDLTELGSDYTEDDEDADDEEWDWVDVGEDVDIDLGNANPVPVDPFPLPEDNPDGLFQELPKDEAKHRKRSRKPERHVGGRSGAPAVLIVVDKGHGTVDAFWFYFYSFNLGNTVFNVRFGNHVGDWEHSMIRFKNGKPKAVFFSEHSFGEAYTYEAVEKIGKRPVVYSATGTHAMYATPGLHPYILPWGVLHDQTDEGPLWDPTLNSYSYIYNYVEDELRSSNFTPKAPTEWFYFTGHWGDKFYPLSDERQYRFAGQYHYVNGPLGPRFKHLGRRKLCQGSVTDPCTIRTSLAQSPRLRRWRGPGIGEQITDEDIERVLGNKTDPF